MITLEKYCEAKHGQAIQGYMLADDRYTNTPLELIEEAKTDNSRHNIVIMNNGQIVGFYCLHLGKAPEIYGFSGKENALVRGFSIDDRFRKMGFAYKSLVHVFEFIEAHVSPDVRKLVLGVNVKNIPAQKTYEKAGFEKLFVTEGRKGDLWIMGKVKSDDI